MIKRTLIVIGVVLGIVFIPYFLGMIEINKTLSEVPNYLRGIIYICIIFLLLGIFQKVYEYIRYNN